MIVKNEKDAVDVIVELAYEEVVNNRKKQPKWYPEDKYYKIRNLQIDERGSLGQRLLVNAFKDSGFRSINDNDKNKDWDIKMDNYRVEVKTATLDVNNKFQHESVHKTNNYDLLVFVDIAPNEVYVKGMLYNDIPFDKLHQRGDGRKHSTGSGYKYDYKLIDHINEKNEIKTMEDFIMKSKIWKQKLDEINK